MNTSDPIFLAAPRRVHRKRKPGAPSAGPAGLQVVGVENVVYDEPLLTFTLVFDTTEAVPLVVDGLDPDKWSATYEGGAFTSYQAEVVSFDRITVTVQGFAGEGGPNAVAYAADPSDVSDTNGRQLAAFSGFPL